MEREKRRVLLQVLLFITTFITTTLAGAEWAYSKFLFVLTDSFSIHWNDRYTWNDFLSGMEFSVPFLLILTVHEFGHYFTALANKVRTSLPYYIPLPPGFLSIGTLGAVIRIRSRVISNVMHFDIGLAGPLAGFIVALGVLYYGFTTLPPPEYIFQFHPDYEAYGLSYADHVYTHEYFRQQGGGTDVQFGSNLLFLFFSEFVADPQRVPNPHELMHYPVLMAGFIALFITSLNLLPIGQLDGGHVVYGLFGRKGHRAIASVFFVMLLFYSGLGAADVYQQRDDLAWMIPVGIVFYYICLQGIGLPAGATFMYAVVIIAVQLLLAWIFPGLKGYTGWLVFAFLLGRILGVHHPPSEIEAPLTSGRKILGWICLAVFVLCFTPTPLALESHIVESSLAHDQSYPVTKLDSISDGYGDKKIIQQQSFVTVTDAHGKLVRRIEKDKLSDSLKVFVFSPSAKYFVASRGNETGGADLLFYNANDSLVKRHSVDFEPLVRFSPDEKFVTVNNANGKDVLLFDRTGNVLFEGDFTRLTGSTDKPLNYFTVSSDTSRLMLNPGKSLYMYDIRNEKLILELAGKDMVSDGRFYGNDRVAVKLSSRNDEEGGYEAEVIAADGALTDYFRFVDDVRFLEDRILLVKDSTVYVYALKNNLSE